MVRQHCFRVYFLYDIYHVKLELNPTRLNSIELLGITEKSEEPCPLVQVGGPGVLSTFTKSSSQYRIEYLYIKCSI